MRLHNACVFLEHIKNGERVSIRIQDLFTLCILCFSVYKKYMVRSFVSVNMTVFRIIIVKLNEWQNHKASV